MPPIGLNRVLLIGTVASTPHYKLTKHKQLPRLWFRLRTVERFEDRDGEERERRGFHTIVVWGNHGRALSDFLREGHAVAIEGRLSTHHFEQGGKKRYETEVIATSVVVLTPRSERADAA